MRVEAFGAVLAGGRARRLEGRDKALLDLGDGPLIGHTVARLARVTAGVAVIGDPVRHAGFGAPVFADRRPDCGPLGGLDTALGLSGSPFVLLLACDLPFVGPGLMERLLAAPEEVDVVVPCVRGRDEPLCARYSARLRPVVNDAMDAGHLKMIDLYEGRNVHRLDVLALGIAEEELLNINHPEDLELARRVAAERRSARERD